MKQRRRRARKGPATVVIFPNDSFELNGVTYHFDPSRRAGAKVAAAA